MKLDTVAFENIRNGKKSFEEWSGLVDGIFIRKTGLGRDDWPDQDWWDMWDSGYSPEEAFREAIENEYGEEGLEAFD